MIKKGIVSSISTGKARVTFPDMDKVVTYELPLCLHVGELNIGDTVIVAFLLNNLTDGIVIGKVN